MSLFGYTDPWSDLRDMQRQMNRLINSFGVGDITSDVPLLTSGAGGGGGGQQQQQQGAGGQVGRVGTGAGQLGQLGQLGVGQWNPQIDVRETDQGLVLHAELPGCNRDDIKLSIDNNRLVLEGHKRTHKKDKGESWVRKERFEGSFYRTLPLPRGVDASQIQANYQDGVLEVAIPKPSGSPTRQMIDIRTSSGSSSSSSGQASL